MERVYVTFIYQSRYQFFVQGLQTTLILTFSSFLLGTVCGIVLCAGGRSKHAAIRRTTSIFRSACMEIPTMVLLMIMVYIIFGSSSLPVMVIVAVGLTLKAASYLSEIFDTALNTVADGEVEAARTLGMTRWQAFRYVTLPQTVTSALPLYENQFISTMQETSVVGYLAIVDLTRASSIVSSRTLDAFFGLITITIIYFLIGKVAKRFFQLLIDHQAGGEAA